MEDLDPDLRQALAAQQEGRYDDALASLLAVSGRDEFPTLFLWRLLAEDHAPARVALARVRDEQALRLVQGDFTSGPGRDTPGARFVTIVRMNEILGDAHATSTLFARLEALAPGQARREAYLALPSIVEVGDFARAERYLPRDPLARIEELNALARRLPLLPPDRSAPRLAAELSNFMKAVRLCAATWEGLGRGLEAGELRAAALAGLATDEMRDLAGRELAEPDAITREITALWMARDEAGAS